MLANAGWDTEPTTHQDKDQTSSNTTTKTRQTEQKRRTHRTHCTAAPAGALHTPQPLPFVFCCRPLISVRATRSLTTALGATYSHIGMASCRRAFSPGIDPATPPTAPTNSPGNKTSEEREQEPARGGTPPPRTACSENTMLPTVHSPPPNDQLAARSGSNLSGREGVRESDGDLLLHAHAT
ncbi:hypothetical protein GGTG_04777 [Gaeumannomyces tritici R3-111a-1]|uniref:Uncharacterized protein n=1 Tax=Gaeumannomyces tritici (strain R3-111a-1) TaxID=644352 RepID=J3NU26_GAET3|nr:hypothetical protein GGTG_04777 [Gaeumannomyces tritici R3-111a-1]EJT79693.1 hypothetical protein GGTG_04777 [Gaeumannomyces tritici R3-111a-1]